MDWIWIFLVYNILLVLYLECLFALELLWRSLNLLKEDLLDLAVPVNLLLGVPEDASTLHWASPAAVVAPRSANVKGLLEFWQRWATAVVIVVGLVRIENERGSRGKTAAESWRGWLLAVQAWCVWAIAVPSLCTGVALRPSLVTSGFTGVTGVAVGTLVAGPTVHLRCGWHL